jgi:cold shock CspA family protein/ribosome-associated translation inhibitor RaiA
MYPKMNLDRSIQAQWPRRRATAMGRLPDEGHPMQEDNVQIVFRGLEPSDALETRVRQHVAALDRFAPHVTGFRVAVDLPHQQHHKGCLYSVRIDVRLRRGELAVSRQHRHDHSHEDVYTAIRDAFAALTRRLEDHVRTLQGSVKRHEVPNHGKIAKLFRDDGYGFIEAWDGTDVYFHEHSVSNAPFVALHVGDEVRFVLADKEGDRGPQASTVTTGKPHPGGFPEMPIG